MAPRQSLITVIAFSLIAILSSSTLVTFYVGHEVQQPLDQVEISAIVKVNGESLEKSIEDASQIIQNIEKAVTTYCQLITPKDKIKQECKDLVQASAYSIKPQYQLLKKKQLFVGFIVAHQISIIMKESPQFGQLVDDIMKIGVNKINSLEWKPTQEVNGEEIAVEDGMQQAKQICKKLGLTLGKVVSVEQVTDFGEQKQEQEGQQQQQQEQQEQEDPVDIKEGFIYYKFVVECTRKTKK